MFLSPDDEEYISTRAPLLERSPPRSSFYVLSLVLTIISATDLAGSVSKAPLIQVYESIICLEHYRINPISNDGQIGERYCKVAPVQEELALLQGWQDFFNNLPGLFIAIPFGLLADKYGRKWLSVVNVTSLWMRAVWICIVCAFPQILPLRLVWLQGALTVFGGGTLVSSALFLVTITDITPESHRANVFFYTHAILCGTEFLGPPVSSALMNRSPWIPLALSIALLTMNIPLSLLLPETLSRTQDRSLVSKNTIHIPSTTFLADHRILLILFTSIPYIFAQTGTNTVTQYTSRRYNWSISQSAYLGSVRAFIMLFAFLVALPLASTYLLRRRSSSPLKNDILLLRISFTIVTVGLLIEGLAPSIPLFIIGSCVATSGMGATALIRSILSSLVRQDEVGRLFAIMSLVWTAAMLIASPVVVALFNEGLKRGGVWTGLPFLFTGLLFVVATAAIWVADLDRRGLVEQQADFECQNEFGKETGEEKGGLLEEEPQSPLLVFKLEHRPHPKHHPGKHIPAPLALEQTALSGLQRPRFLGSPLCSPGLQMLEARRESEGSSS